MHFRLVVLALVLMIGGACRRSPATTAPTPVVPAPAPELATPAPALPPTLAEIDPPPGQELDPRSAITLFFDQEMDQESVLAALTLQPAVQASMLWTDNRTLRIEPLEPLQNGASYRLAIEGTAQSLSGEPLLRPLEVLLTTSGHLSVTHVSPPDGSQQVDPQTPIYLAFNRPVVAMPSGPSPPQPLLLEPPVSGQGVWISTALYRFLPDKPLEGGVVYRARVPAGLTDLGGAILPLDHTWEFSTSLPSISSLTPEPQAVSVALDQSVVVAFNQPMDRGSVEEAFALSSTAGQVQGSFQWDEHARIMTFRTQELLAYSTDYQVLIRDSAAAISGARLPSSLSSSFSTVPLPSVTAAIPGPEQMLAPQASLAIRFSAPMDQASLQRALQVSPQPEGLHLVWDADDETLRVFAQFAPRSQYLIALGNEALDLYGTALTNPFQWTVLTSDLEPLLEFPQFGEVVALDGNRPARLKLILRNLSQVDLQLYRLSLDSFLEILAAGSLLFEAPTPQGTLERQWTLQFDLESNRTHTSPILLQQEGLPSGLYLLLASSPQVGQPAVARLLVSRQVELVLKSSRDQALIWAIDLDDGQPVSGLPIQLVDQNRGLLASGETDADGLLSLKFDPPEDPYAWLYAMANPSGGGLFGLTSSAFDHGLSPYSFGLDLQFVQRPALVYLYTDRPIYRPGETVRYRGIVREVAEDRYLLPSASSLEITVRNPRGQVLARSSRPLSSFGTIEGQIELGEDAALGTYQIESEHGRVTFDLAAYRKPEIDLEILFSSQELASGDPLQAVIQATYFFGAPAAGAHVSWELVSEPYLLDPLSPYSPWLAAPASLDGLPHTEAVAQGAGTTNEDGLLELDLPTGIQSAQPVRLALTVHMTDSSALSTRARRTVTLHPSAISLALHPERYHLPAGETAMLRLEAHDWSGEVLTGVEAEIVVERLGWRQVVDEQGSLTWESSAERVNVGTVITSDDGGVLFAFQPEIEGTYRLVASGSDQNARPASAEIFLWATGQQALPWAQPIAGRIDLVPDRSRYRPGDTAAILIPSPLQSPAWALVSLERNGILSRQVRQLAGGDSIFEVPILPEYAPNVYLSVVLVSPTSVLAPISVGMLMLQVDPSQHELVVTLDAHPEQAAPGSQVQYRLQARDRLGNPVQAEFSLALADLAALTVIRPNSLSPMEHFYGRQPLGVRTAASLAVGPDPLPPVGREDGIGGGEEAAPLQLRSLFPETAFWNPSVVTDASGLAEGIIELPDSLTTWRMEARGASLATQVGMARLDTTTSKPLLIRPITARFFTAGDEAVVAAMIHNNEERAFPVQARLIVSGARLLSAESLTVQVQPGQPERVEWRLEIGAGSRVDLIFQASGAGWQDASTATVTSAADGGIPVLQYSAADTVASAGVLAQQGEILEIINLPRQVDATRGSLRLTLEPSLGGTLLEALESLERPASHNTEQVASQLVAYSAAGRSLQAQGEAGQALLRRLAPSIGQAVLSLAERQNPDGGWGWWPGGDSSSPLTGYVLMALSEAARQGHSLGSIDIQASIQFLQAGVAPVELLASQDALQSQSFILHALARAGAGDPATIRQMAATDLTPAATLDLLQAMGLIARHDPAVQTLLAKMRSSAIPSATGAHWENPSHDLSPLGTSVRTTAQAVTAMSSLDPEDPLLPRALRWLISARAASGGWASTLDTAWAMWALADWGEAFPAGDHTYTYRASLNGSVISSGQASPDASLATVVAEVPVADLLADRPNALRISRAAGSGALHYRAHLQIFLPAEQVRASARGLAIARQIFRDDGTCSSSLQPCPEVDRATAGEDLLIRLTLSVPNALNHVQIEDFFPAGAEPYNPDPIGSWLAASGWEVENLGEFGAGWGEAWFDYVEMHDERIVLYAEHLPAGSYQYTYRLHATFPGRYRLLPARAWALYFPEVYGHGAGMIFTIEAP